MFEFEGLGEGRLQELGISGAWALPQKGSSESRLETRIQGTDREGFGVLGQGKYMHMLYYIIFYYILLYYIIL